MMADLVSFYAGDILCHESVHADIVRRTEERTTAKIVAKLRDPEFVEYVYQMTNATTAGNLETLASMLENPDAWEGMP